MLPVELLRDWILDFDALDSFGKVREGFAPVVPLVSKG